MKPNSDYNPSPIDTSDVKLPASLTHLVEEMAKNVHDVWSRNRMDEGWSYGPTRDDRLKTHPCLVPYEDLPNSEKEYDRATATATLKFILKSGFRIVKD